MLWRFKLESALDNLNVPQKRSERQLAELYENCIFLYHWPVLSETFILNQLTWLIDHGHEIAIFCKSKSLHDEPVEHDDHKRYNLKNKTFYYGTTSQRLPKNRILRLTKALWIFSLYLFNNPAPLLKSMNFAKYGRMATSFWMFFLVAPFLKWNLEKFDIACCHFGPNGELAAKLKDIGLLKGKSASEVMSFGRKSSRMVRGRTFWARGYCVSTVGLDEAKIREYIRN